jgi:hypothetical protein
MVDLAPFLRLLLGTRAAWGDGFTSFLAGAIIIGDVLGNEVGIEIFDAGLEDTHDAGKFDTILFQARIETSEYLCGGSSHDFDDLLPKNGFPIIGHLDIKQFKDLVIRVEVKTEWKG